MTHEALRPRPPAHSRLDLTYARSSKARRSTQITRSMAGFIVSVTIKPYSTSFTKDPDLGRSGPRKGKGADLGGPPPFPGRLLRMLLCSEHESRGKLDDAWRLRA